jgi:hypothetical protein
MIRRTVNAAATGLVCAALMVGTAHAFTRAEAICVKAARTRAKTNLKAARDAATSQLNAEIRTCLNDTGGHCVTDCLTQQALDQAGPNGILKTCRDGCKAANSDDVTACGSNADPVGCVEQAQLKLFLCNQGCQAAVQQQLIDINGNFEDCLQGCSNPTP